MLLMIFLVHKVKIYLHNRVFFPDEDIAISAGNRSCAVTTVAHAVTAATKTPSNSKVIVPQIIISEIPQLDARQILFEILFLDKNRIFF